MSFVGRVQIVELWKTIKSNKKLKKIKIKRNVYKLKEQLKDFFFKAIGNLNDHVGKLHEKSENLEKNEERWEKEPRVIARKINKFRLLRYRQSAEHHGSTLCLRLLTFSEKITYLTTEIIISERINPETHETGTRFTQIKIVCPLNRSLVVIISKY